MAYDRGELMNNIKCIETVKLWNAGEVSLYDFSNTNSSQEAREEACALVSGANYGKTIANPSKHYERLLTENGGRASEVLGFIPYTFDISADDYLDRKTFNRVLRFGYLEYGKNGKLLTNLRNVVNLKQDKEARFETIEFSNNHKNFIVMKIKIPYMIVDHLRRHQLLNQHFSENWQSNRSSHAFEYFSNDELREVIKKYYIGTLCAECYDSYVFGYTSDEFWQFAKVKTNYRQELFNKGTFGLRYVTGWLCGWLEDEAGWQNMLNVRLTKNTQKETKELVTVMKQLIYKHY